MKPPKKLKLLNPCDDALDWLSESKSTTPQEAWESCERGDWMLWLLGKLSGIKRKNSGIKRKKLVLATCGCARLVLAFVREGENRPRICIETAEKWARGKVTLQEVKESKAATTAAYAAAAAYAADAYAADAADAAAATTAAAYAAATAAYAADAAYATDAAAYAATTAAYAAYAAAYAASAAYAAYAADAAYAAYAADAADAAYADATATVRAKALADCADVIRKFYPQAPRL